MSRRKYNVWSSSEEEDDEIQILEPEASTSKSAKEKDSSNDENEEEAIGDEQESVNFAYYAALLKLTKAEFHNKEKVTTLNEEVLRQQKQGKAKGRPPIHPTKLSWKNNTIMYCERDKLESYVTRFRTRSKAEKFHQVYIAMTISSEIIEGKSSAEVWHMLKNEQCSKGWYVGVTHRKELGIRREHFLTSANPRSSATRREMQNNSCRCFQVAVLITASEGESKALEEYIIHFLAKQEQLNNEMKKLNGTLDFIISSNLREKAQKLAEEGKNLVIFQEEGENDSSNYYELEFVCKLRDFIEKRLN